MLRLRFRQRWPFFRLSFRNSSRRPHVNFRVFIRLSVRTCIQRFTAGYCRCSPDLSSPRHLPDTLAFASPNTSLYVPEDLEVCFRVSIRFWLLTNSLRANPMDFINLHEVFHLPPPNPSRLPPYGGHRRKKLSHLPIWLFPASSSFSVLR